MFTSASDVRSEVESFAPYEAGLSIAEIQQKYGLARVIKMASNENPLGTSPVVQAAVQRHAGQAFRYPQAGNPRLVQALAAHLGIDPAHLFLGNGSDEVIDLLFRVRAVPGVHHAVAFKPCFGIYTTQACLNGVSLRQAPLGSDFHLNLNALSALIDENTSLVFITSPDNPSGATIKAAELAAFAQALPPACLLVVDEAYIEFASSLNEYSLFSRIASGELTNVALLRTFSKLYGLAGLRVGYGILPSRLAEYLWRVRLPFSVNILAEEAVLAVLEDRAFQEESRRVVLAGRAQLTDGLRALGCVVYPSQANFLLVKPLCSARALNQALLQRGLIIRTLGAYDLPDHVRISVGTAEENTFLLQAMAEILPNFRRS